MDYTYEEDEGKKYFEKRRHETKTQFEQFVNVKETDNRKRKHKTE